jgi:NTE family protein
MQDDFDAAYDLWYNIKPSRVIAGDDKMLEKIMKMDLEGKDFHKVVASFSKMVGQKGLDITPLREMIAEMLKEDVIRQSKKTFGFVTVSLSNFKPVQMYKEDIPVGQMAAYLIASANLPIFKLDRIDGKLYVDGGFYDNLPINLLASKGFKEIITIELNGIGFRQKVAQKDKDNGLKITNIRPSGDLGRTMELLPETARRNLLMGYYDTMRVYRKLIGQKYYLEGTLGQDYYFNWLCRLNDEAIAELAQMMGLPDRDPKRLLFEQIMPKFFGLLNLEGESNYRDVVLALLEHIAMGLDIDRYAIFKDNEFMQRICYELENKPFTREEHEKKTTLLPKLVKQTRVYQNYIMDELAFTLLDALMQDNR